VLVDDQNTFGEQQKLVPEVLRENVVEFPAIDPKSRSGKWRNQINFGFGLGLDPLNTPPLPSHSAFSSPSASTEKATSALGYSLSYLFHNYEVSLGIRRIPNLLVGVGYNKMRLLFNDTIAVWGNPDSIATMDAQAFERDYLSFNLKYLIGPRFLPGIRLLLGSSLSLAGHRHRLIAGVQLGLGKRTKLEFTTQYLMSREDVTTYTFNHSGSAMKSEEKGFWIQRPLFYLTLIKKISW
jgi:hypothetical protein